MSDSATPDISHLQAGKIRPGRQRIRGRRQISVSQRDVEIGLCPRIRLDSSTPGIAMLFTSGKRILVFGAILIVAGVWLAIDLTGFGLHSSDLREFDPDAVARLETDMWRSYYDRRQLLLF